VTSQVASLKAAGADTFIIFATPKFAAQAMIAAAQQSWKPTIYLTNVGASQPVMVGATKAGGVDATKNVITLAYLKDPNDPQWASDPGMKMYHDIVAKYAPGADATDQNLIYGVAAAYTMVDALTKAGKDLTRAKIMDVVSHLDEPNNPFALPGVAITTTPSFRFPIAAGQLETYSDGRFHLIGKVIDVRKFVQEAEQK
jgi:branched-chain amino acid transport system substrate-binding protein